MIHHLMSADFQLWKAEASLLKIKRLEAENNNHGKKEIISKLSINSSFPIDVIKIEIIFKDQFTYPFIPLASEFWP